MYAISVYLMYAISFFEHGALSDFRVMLCSGSRGSYLLNNYRKCIFVFEIAFQCNLNLDGNVIFRLEFKAFTLRFAGQIY